MNYQCGHRHCRARYKFAKPLENYKRRPRSLTKDWRCGVCGKGYLNECTVHIRRWDKRRGLCKCSGLHYPHRRASPGCDHAPHDPYGLAKRSRVGPEECPF